MNSSLQVKIEVVEKDEEHIIQEINIIDESNVCGHCGKQLTHVPQVLKWYGNHFCRDCVVTCAECGRIEPSHLQNAAVNEMHTSHIVPRTLTSKVKRSNIVRFLCDTCVKERYHICSSCGLFFKNKHPRVYDGCTWCKKCYDAFIFTCCQCQEVSRVNDSTHTTSDGRLVCDKCFTRDHKVCTSCGRYFMTSDGICDSVTGAYYCKRCADYNVSSCDSEETPFRPCPKYFGQDPNNLFFGVEIEMENKGNESNDRVWHMVQRADSEGFFYCKNDGSLSYGFEAITHPFSFSWMKENMNKWDIIWALKEDPTHFRAMETQTCGLHVHMTAAAFTNKHLYKFIKFFYSDYMYNFIVTLSQRDSGALEQWANLDGTRFDNHTECKRLVDSFKDKNSVGRRYSAVNLTNRHTVEIRIFRGSLNQNTFFKNVEFCHAVYEFTKQASSSSILSPSVRKGFMTFVLEHSQQYPHLAAFVVLNNRFEAESPQTENAIMTLQNTTFFADDDKEVLSFSAERLCNLIANLENFKTSCSLEREET